MKEKTEEREKEQHTAREKEGNRRAKGRRWCETVKQNICRNRMSECPLQNLRNINKLQYHREELALNNSPLGETSFK